MSRGNAGFITSKNRRLSLLDSSRERSSVSLHHIRNKNRQEAVKRISEYIEVPYNRQNGKAEAPWTLPFPETPDQSFIWPNLYRGPFCIYPYLDIHPEDAQIYNNPAVSSTFILPLSDVSSQSVIGGSPDVRASCM